MVVTIVLITHFHSLFVAETRKKRIDKGTMGYLTFNGLLTKLHVNACLGNSELSIIALSSRPARRIRLELRPRNPSVRRGKE